MILNQKELVILREDESEKKRKCRINDTIEQICVVSMLQGTSNF